MKHLLLFICYIVCDLLLRIERNELKFNGQSFPTRQFGDALKMTWSVLVLTSNLGERRRERRRKKRRTQNRFCTQKRARMDGRTDGRTDGRRRRRRDGGVRNGIHSMPASPKPSLIVKYNEEQQTSNICECTALQCSRWNQIALNQLATRS